MEKKLKVLFMCLLVICIVVGMKRKYESDVEEKGDEEVKKVKPEVYQQSKTLLFQMAQKVIHNFLETKNEVERDKLRVDYENTLTSEMKEYIKSLVNRKNEIGETLLHNAKNRWEVEQLLFLGADSEIESKLAQYPLTAMLMKGNREAAEVFMSLRGHTPEEVVLDFAGYTSLHYALLCNAILIVKNILEYPANVPGLQLNKRVGAWPGVTPLILAARYCPDAIKLLIEVGGANIDRGDFSEVTPLLYAAEVQPPQVIELLLSLGADINDVDDSDENIIFYAVKKNNDFLLNYLIKEKKLDINVANNVGITPLALATDELTMNKNYHRQKETIKELILLGANINKSFIQSKYGLLSVIINRGIPFKLIKFFIKHGADVNYIDKSDENGYPLACAIFENYNHRNHVNTVRKNLHFGLINFLIGQGAKIMPYDRLIILESENAELINAIWKADVFQQ